jgi:hypothetical protein
MAAIPLTLAVSLSLVFTFIVFFLREHARGRLSSAERDSLLPLAEESPRLARAVAGSDEAHHGDRADGDACGCRTGRRAPCAGCLRGRT